MNCKFQAGLRILTKVISPLKNMNLDPIIANEIQSVTIMLRCITDDLIDYVKI